MSIIQFFSKNFFSKYFPDRYFQKKTSGSVTINVTGLAMSIAIGVVTVVATGQADANINVNGETLHLNIGTVTVQTNVPPTPVIPSVNFQAGLGAKPYKSLHKYPVHVEINTESNLVLLSYINDVRIETTCNWETDEEIIEIVTVMFKLLYYTPDYQYNDVDEEEAIVTLLITQLF